jgi:hypothetical protein
MTLQTIDRRSLEDAEEGDQLGKPHTPKLNDCYAKFKDSKVTDLIQILTIPSNRKQATSSADYFAVVMVKGVFRMNFGDGNFWISGHNTKGSIQLHDFEGWTFVKRDLVDKTFQEWNVDARLQYAKEHPGEVELYRCPKCCNVELFKPGEFEADEKSDKPLKRYNVYCPICMGDYGKRGVEDKDVLKLEKVTA